MDGRNGMRRTALSDHVACAGFASAALRGHAEFELHLVERHSGTRMAGDLSVGHSTANANDHGVKAVAGWLQSADYKYEFFAFAISIDLAGF